MRLILRGHNALSESFNPRTRAGCDDEGWVGSRSNETFQSTHPRGVRPGRASRDKGLRGLSIHAPARGATTKRSNYNNNSNTFNPRTRAGCDGASNSKSASHQGFQSTHPRGVRRNWPHSFRNDSGFQSTHPRGVRLYEGDVVKVGMDLSIHAPARGATRIPLSGAQKGFDFQSTHPRGVRRRQSRQAPTIRHFQSTHPRGVRRTERMRSCAVWHFQSTHPRGVRRHGLKGMSTLPLFQSTHPRGVRRHNRLLVARRNARFQSTHPRGVRRRRKDRAACLPVPFNPRTRAGCDFFQPSNIHFGRPFNPRTRAGCDGSVPGADRCGDVLSIHAPARGATIISRVCCSIFITFNPRTRAGCDSGLVLPRR